MRKYKKSVQGQRELFLQINPTELWGIFKQCPKNVSLNFLKLNFSISD